MEKLIGILIFSFGSSIGMGGSGVTPALKTSCEKAAIILNEPAGHTRHFITDHDCHIIKEWLDRKSVGHFIRKHISAIQGMDKTIEKTHLNDTFTP